MNRRRFLALTAFFLARPSLAAAIDDDTPICEDVKGRVGDWRYAASPEGYDISAGGEQFLPPWISVTAEQRASYGLRLAYGDGFTLTAQLPGHQTRDANNKWAQTWREGYVIGLSVDGRREIALAEISWQLEDSDIRFSDIEPAELEAALTGGQVAQLTLVDRKRQEFAYKSTISLKGFTQALQAASKEHTRLQADYMAGKCTKMGQCFITTAVCDTVGLADDCFELTTLRRFRDRYLIHQPGGAEQIAHYYRTAPEIVHAIEKRPEARGIWLRVYARWILPAVLFEKLGLSSLARRSYTRMVQTLSYRYL